MTAREWIDSVKKLYKKDQPDLTLREFYYGEGGTNGILVYDGKKLIRTLIRTEDGYVACSSKIEMRAE